MHDLKWKDRLTLPPVSLPVNIPTAWQTVALTFYNSPLTLRYNLTQRHSNNISYVVSVVYTNPIVYSAFHKTVQSTPPPTVQLHANNVIVHDFISPPPTPHRMPFKIPAKALSANHSNYLDLTWSMPSNVGGSGTGCHVAEVLLQTSTQAFRTITNMKHLSWL